MVVVIQTVLAVVGDVDVRPPVVVIITDSRAESPALVAYSRLVGHVAKCAVVIIVKQHGSGRGLVSFECRDGRTIQKIDIEPAVVVIVEQGNAGARSFDDRFFFWSSGTMVKFIEAGEFRYVLKDDRRIVHEAARCDRARLGVFNGSMCGAG